MELNRKVIRNVFIGVLGCIFFYWLLHETDRVELVWNFLKGIFSPFVLGGVLAFIINVPVRAFDSLLKGIRSDVLRRVLSICLTMIVVCIVIAGVVMLVIPQLTSTVETLLGQLPGFFERLEKNVLDFLEQRPELMEWVQENDVLKNFNWSSIIEKVASTVGTSLTVILNGAINAVSSLAQTIFNLVVSIVFAFYCLARKETLARQGRRLLYAVCKERHADEIVRILRMTNSAFSNFLTGQCLEALILGLLFVIFMAIFRMPYIPLISVLIAVTALVPLVGAFVGCILGAFFILVNDPMQAVGFVIMFLAIQQFEGNVIYPRVVGSSIGLPGMWVLLAVAIGGGMMGVGGMFLMVPIASVIYTLIREFAHKRLNKKQIDPDKLMEHPPELQSHFVMKAKHMKKKRMEKRLKKQNETNGQTKD